MNTKNIFDHEVDGYSIYTVEDALAIIRGMVWSEIETTKQALPRHSKLFCELGEIACYYDYAGDYYIFVDNSF
jgi:hypothetical protein